MCEEEAKGQVIIYVEGGGRKTGGPRPFQMSKEGGLLCFFWYKDKGESYDSARFMRRYT